MAAKRKASKASQRRPWRHEVSAGGLVWRRRPGDSTVEVVLVKPAGKDTWVLPKGHIEEEEGVIDAAVRETEEETGLKVSPGKPIGDVSYVYSWRDRPEGPLVRIFKRVHFFLMEFEGVSGAGHDAEIEEVGWLDIDEALRRATYQSERELIAKARTTLLNG